MGMLSFLKKKGVDTDLEDAPLPSYAHQEHEIVPKVTPPNKMPELPPEFSISDKDKSKLRAPEFDSHTAIPDKMENADDYTEENMEHIKHATPYHLPSDTQTQTDRPEHLEEPKPDFHIQNMSGLHHHESLAPPPPSSLFTSENHDSPIPEPPSFLRDAPKDAALHKFDNHPSVNRPIHPEHTAPINPKQHRIVPEKPFSPKKMKIRKDVDFTRPLFIAAHEYKESIDAIIDLQKDISEIDAQTNHITEMENQKEEQFHKWQDCVEDIQRKIIFLDRTLFQ